MTPVDDREVTEAFVNGARKAFGPDVHIEGDRLYWAGWWEAALRVANGVFLLRNEEPPDDSPILGMMVQAFSAWGLKEVGIDLPAMTQLVYTEFTLLAASWALWAADLAAGESALEARVTSESLLDSVPLAVDDLRDLGAELGGARRLAGLAPSVILTVGVGADAVGQLTAGLPECRVITRGFDDISPEQCGSLTPTLIVVDAARAFGPGAGGAFIEGLRADPFCRFLPVAVVVSESEAPEAADISLDPEEPTAWAASLRRVLP